MRPLLAALSIVLFAAVSPASANGESPFQFGLESRFGEPIEFSNTDYSWGVIPNFSYQVSERFRVDAFAGFSWSDSGNYSVRLQPGFRYYLRPPTGKLRLNTGLALGFTVLEKSDDQVVTADGQVVEIPQRDDVWLRVVPIEAEYWTHSRWGWTLALDYQTRIGDTSGLVEDEGFGIAAGFRYRIR